MPKPFEQPIELPFNANDREVAVALLYIFQVGFCGDPDGTGEGMAELTDNLAGSLEFIRNHPLAQAYQTEPKRLPDGTWLGELWWLMFPLGYTWRADIDDRNPAGPFPEPELGNRPAANTGADFIYMALRAIGLKFSDEEFRDQFYVMLDYLRKEMDDDLDDEDDVAE